MEIKNLPPINTLADGDISLIQTTDGVYHSVSISTLKTIFGSSGTNSNNDGNNSSSSTSVTKSFTYVSDGDTNGLFYWIGTKEGTQSWSNPIATHLIYANMSSQYDSSHFHPEYLFDRQVNDDIATANIPNSFYQIDLVNIAFQPNYYSIRARNYNANNPQSWNLLGSVDTTSWDVLDTVTNNPLSQNQWCSRPVSTNKSYYYFRIVQTGLSTSGDNIFCVGEFEIYGNVLSSTTTNNSNSTTNNTTVSATSSSDLITSGLTNWWKFNESSGTQVTDAITSKKGDLVGATSWYDGASVGLDFHDSGYVQLPSGVYFNGDFTIEIVWYQRSYQTWSRLLDFGNGRYLNAVIAAATQSNSGRPMLSSQDQQELPGIYSAISSPIYQWSHWFFSLANDTAAMYCNLINVAKGKQTIPTNVVRNNCYFGKSNYPDNYLDGVIAAIKIWNRALNRDERIQQFKATRTEMISKGIVF